MFKHKKRVEDDAWAASSAAVSLWAPGPIFQ